MADFTENTAEQALKKKRHRDRFRGEAEWTRQLARRPWDHIWRLQFSRHMSTAQAAENLHNYLTGVLSREPRGCRRQDAVGLRRREGQP